jgi:predicted transposase YbfD/YdcC
LAAATALLDVVPLAGRVVTADALLTQRARCEQIVARGGDYLLPVDANQPSLRTEVEEAFSPVARRRPRPRRRPDPPALAE